MRDVTEALAWLEHERRNGSPRWYNLCLMLARTAYGIPARHREADIAWTHTQLRSAPLAKPPAGWFVWWDRAGDAYRDGDAGHVAVSAGGGLVYSNDVRRRGRVDLVSIASITSGWRMRYVGCSRDVNGVTAVKAPAKARPGRDLGDVVTIRRGDTLSGLVAEHGPRKADWRMVWHHPRNAGLRALRRRPELIRPGDKLWIP